MCRTSFLDAPISGRQSETAGEATGRRFGLDAEARALNHNCAGASVGWSSAQPG